MVWTPTQIQFSYDNQVMGVVDAGAGFWDRGGPAFQNSGYVNPWNGGTLMAPFDQEFYIIMNVATGGTAFFVDSWVNEGGNRKPW